MRPSRQLDARKCPFLPDSHFTCNDGSTSFPCCLLSLLSTKASVFAHYYSLPSIKSCLSTVFGDGYYSKFARDISNPLPYGSHILSPTCCISLVLLSSRLTPLIYIWSHLMTHVLAKHDVIVALHYTLRSLCIVSGLSCSIHSRTACPPFPSPVASLWFYPQQEV